LFIIYHEEGAVKGRAGIPLRGKDKRFLLGGRGLGGGDKKFWRTIY